MAWRAHAWESRTHRPAAAVPVEEASHLPGKRTVPERFVMADYDQPVPSADEAAEHLRALAHATRHFQDPGETYWVLGDLGAITSRLQEALVNVASAHMNHRVLAHTDDGNRLEGRQHAHEAAMALRRASVLLEDVGRHVDDAQSHSGRIAWREATTPGERDGAEREPQGTVTRRGAKRADRSRPGPTL